MRVVIATGNPGKVREFERMLENYGLPVYSAKELGIRMEVDETGTSFSENALLKCRSIPVSPEEETIVFADDSGLCVDALGGAPGIYSSRYLGEDTPYDVKNAHFLALLKDVPDELRTCRYHCAIGVRFPDGTEEVTEATFEGRIAHEPAGTNGFGYDPIFYLPEYGKTCAEIPSELKDRISHRGKAMRQAEAIIDAWMKKRAAKTQCTCGAQCPPAVTEDINGE
ncbi:MAG: RdgB/HAM1 family non-canonical purine NTP pyrophosphatase [Lachnospiraceae bacterium]|nr:RdgB/HAM1 family non-canonical purine NTP pyrophosphatase [Lachnospiraceae bacterium]